MSAWGKGGLAKSCNALLKRVEDNDPALKELVILPSKTFASLEAARLAAAIGSGKNTNLKSVSASGHALDPSSISLLGAAIAKASDVEGKGITSIALGDRYMGNMGIIALCDSLHDCNGGNLTYVDLEWKGISESGMAAIGSTFGFSSRLQNLNLSRNSEIGDIGLQSFCKHATEKLTKSNDENLSKTHVKNIVFPRLQFLNLSECNIGPDGMKILSEFFLAGTKKDNFYSRSMSLNLNKNPIGNSGLESLAKLISSPFSDEYDEIHSSLISLSLEQCHITDDGIRTLTTAIAKHGCAGLHKLDVSKNEIGEEGAKLMGKSFSTILRTDQSIHSSSQLWRTLTEVNIANNALTSNGVIELCYGIEKLPALKILNLCETSCGVEGAIAALKLKNLNSLRLFNNKLGSDGFNQIASLLKGGHISLVSLDLGGNSAKESAVATLLRALLMKNETFVNSALRVLEIGGNEIGSDAESVLQEMKKKLPLLDVARDRPKIQNQAQTR